MRGLSSGSSGLSDGVIVAVLNISKDILSITLVFASELVQEKEPLEGLNIVRGEPQMKLHLLPLKQAGIERGPLIDCAAEAAAFIRERQTAIDTEGADELDLSSSTSGPPALPSVSSHPSDPLAPRAPLPVIPAGMVAKRSGHRKDSSGSGFEFAAGVHSSRVPSCRGGIGTAARDMGRLEGLIAQAGELRQIATAMMDAGSSTRSAGDDGSGTRYNGRIHGEPAEVVDHYSAYGLGAQQANILRRMSAVVRTPAPSKAEPLSTVVGNATTKPSLAATSRPFAAESGPSVVEIAEQFESGTAQVTGRKVPCHNLLVNECGLTFLGTGCSVPSKYRNVSGIWLKLPSPVVPDLISGIPGNTTAAPTSGSARGAGESNHKKDLSSSSIPEISSWEYGSSMLIDCGEGTWAQLLRQFHAEEKGVSESRHLNSRFVLDPNSATRKEAGGGEGERAAAASSSSSLSSSSLLSSSSSSSLSSSSSPSSSCCCSTKLGALMIARELVAVWVSHPHADHHLGLVTIITERRKALEAAGSRLLPLPLQQCTSRSPCQTPRTAIPAATENACSNAGATSYFAPLVVIAPPAVLAFLTEYAALDAAVDGAFLPVSCRQFDPNDDCTRSDVYWNILAGSLESSRKSSAGSTSNGAPAGKGGNPKRTTTVIVSQREGTEEEQEEKEGKKEKEVEGFVFAFANSDERKREPSSVDALSNSETTSRHMQRQCRPRGGQQGSKETSGSCSR